MFFTEAVNSGTEVFLLIALNLLKPNTGGLLSGFIKRPINIVFKLLNSKNGFTKNPVQPSA
jgi:hypothetical protein